jgi:hypothetical protein
MNDGSLSWGLERVRSFTGEVVGRAGGRTEIMNLGRVRGSEPETMI